MSKLAPGASSRCPYYYNSYRSVELAKHWRDRSSFVDDVQSAFLDRNSKDGLGRCMMQHAMHGCSMLQLPRANVRLWFVVYIFWNDVGKGNIGSVHPWILFNMGKDPHKSFAASCGNQTATQSSCSDELGLQTPRHFYPPSPGHGNFSARE